MGSPRFTITGLKENVVIQSFYLTYEDGDKVIYAVQTTGKPSNNTTNSIIINRCPVGQDDKTASKESYMQITNAGHGTTLVPYVDNNQPYFLVCGKVRTQDNGAYYHTVAIGRIQYNPSTTINASSASSSLHRIIGFDFMNKKGIDYGDVVHVHANLNYAKNKIVFCTNIAFKTAAEYDATKAESKNSLLYFSIFDFSYIKGLLANNTETNIADIQGTTDFNNHFTYQFRKFPNSSYITNHLTNALQNLDMTFTSSEEYVYTVTGNNDNNNGENRITKMNANDGNGLVTKKIKKFTIFAIKHKSHTLTYTKGESPTIYRKRGNHYEQRKKNNQKNHGYCTHDRHGIFYSTGDERC